MNKGAAMKALVFAMSVAVALGGCAAREPLTIQIPPPAQSAAAIAQTGSVDPATQGEAPPARTLFRSVTPRDRPGVIAPADPLAGRTVEFAFRDAPAMEVLDAVVSGQLGMAFTAEAGLNPVLTARTPGPVPALEAIRILNQSLLPQGAELALAGDVIVLRSADGGLHASPGGPGEGAVEMLQLRHVSGARMLSALQPFLDGSVRAVADERRGRITLTGAPDRVAAVREAALALDADWLQPMSFSMLQLRHVPPAAVVTELASITTARDASALLDVIALPRLQAVLLISSSPPELALAEQWVERLDRPTVRQRGFRTIPIRNASAMALAEDIMASLQDRGEAASQVRVRANEESNTLIIWGEDHDHEDIAALVRELDILPAQVLIEVTIAEVTLNEELRYGVQWFFDTRDGGGLRFTDLESGQIASRFPGFAYRFDSRFVQAALNALDSVSDVVILSSPQIVTLNNRSAMLQVGDQVPVITQSAVSVTNPDAPIVNSVQFRDTGVVLRVTPRISGDTIILEIDQEVSDVAETRSSGIDSPTIQQRRFTTVVAARSGDTIALGGLIRETRSEVRSGAPGIRNVPVVGRLFEARSEVARRTELIAFLTPKMVTDARDAREEAQSLASRLREMNARRLLSFED